MGILLTCGSLATLFSGNVTNVLPRYIKTYNSVSTKNTSFVTRETTRYFWTAYKSGELCQLKEILDNKWNYLYIKKMFTYSSYKPDTGALYHKMDTSILSPHHSLLNKALHVEFHVLLPIFFVVFFIVKNCSIFNRLWFA